MRIKDLIWPLLIVFIVLISIGATVPNEPIPKEYRISTTSHTINGKIWVFETKYNVHTGKVTSRKQVKSTKYKNIK